MVSTRSASSRQSSTFGDTPAPAVAPTSSPRKRAAVARTASTVSAVSASAWDHAPTKWTLIWLAISLPLVAWDTGYVLLRPASMPGGALHWPLWAPYELYGRIDHVYGWKAYNAGNGFTGAQATLNLVETIMYLYYAYVFAFRRARGASVSPRETAVALLVGFSAAVMTLSKTALYGAHEYYSGFDNIGHNTLIDLVFLWIIPNGAWLVGSTYMTWSMGGDIIDGLLAATGHPKAE